MPRNFIEAIEVQTVQGTAVTRIRRSKGHDTLLVGRKPHIFRQGGKWITAGGNRVPGDFWKLVAFLANLNAGV